MRVVCEQTILMKYHALYVIFEKGGKIWNCGLLQIIGGALWVKMPPEICSRWLFSSEPSAIKCQVLFQIKKEITIISLLQLWLALT